MSVSISPVFNGAQFFDNLGQPLSGGKLFTYEAGSTSVERTTYSDNTGTTPNPNPIVLTSSGRLDADLWLTDGLAYNIVVTQADGTTVLIAVDDVIGVQASSATPVATGIWNPTGVPTYLSPTSFRVSGDEVATLTVGNRIRATLDSGYAYGTITAVAFSTPNTTVTLEMDGTTLNGSLSATEYSALIVNGKTVDAGAVAYSTSTLSYSTAGTVGNKLRSLESDATALSARVARDELVITTTGTSTAYVLTPTPAATSYAAQGSWRVKFHIANGAAPTLNISALGAKSLKQYTSSGTKAEAVIAADMVTDVLYDGVDFVVADALPAASTTTPRGIQVFTAPGTFTTPAGVSFIKVTCVGGGGGAGNAAADGDGFEYAGGAGGGGCTAVKYLSTTAGTSYPVSIGTAGVGASAAGGTSSFGITTVIASGGTGGTNASGAFHASHNGVSGTGGTTGTGDLVLPGADGSTPRRSTSNLNIIIPQGGGSALSPTNSAGYGVGGNGGAGLVAATAGTQGVVIVEY